MSYILILGAKSDIAQALAREYAKNGYDLYLALRDSKRLDIFGNDLKIRYNTAVKNLELDICQFDSHGAFYENLNPKPAGVICAVGFLGDQEKAQQDFSETEKIISTNFTGCVSMLNFIANDFEKQGYGFIIGISSVAGDRGRKSNFIYGSAKAAFTTYLSGLRNRLYDAGVQVLTVKPGFVDTQMTRNMDLPEKLTAQPEDVARAIFKASQKGKNTIYCKERWRFIMWIIRMIPEFQFKKMSI
jgi:decaprenylphospho-beta-D-erythro-pentofuranosid-2-ulose 2-reductase